MIGSAENVGGVVRSDTEWCWENGGVSGGEWCGGRMAGRLVGRTV